MEEKQSKFDFSAIKRPVLLLAILPAIVILILASNDIKQHFLQLREADRTEDMVTFSRLLVEFSHHLAREQVALETIDRSEQIEPWRNRTNEAWNNVLTYYKNNLSDEERHSKLLTTYIERTDTLIKGRDSGPLKINDQQLDYLFRSPRLLVSNILGESISPLYQQHLQTLLTFLRAKENIYAEGILVGRVLKKGAMSEDDFEKITRYIWNKDEYFDLFREYATDKQMSFFRVKNSNPVFSEIDAIHKRLLMRLKEYDLLSSLGYLGFIHDFKNYILRGKEEYYVNAIASYKRARKILDTMMKESTESERLLPIKEMLNDYFKMLPVAKKMWGQGIRPELIDGRVKVDDSNAAITLEWMRDGVINFVGPNHWRELWEAQVEQLRDVKREIGNDLLVVTSKARERVMMEFYWYIALILVSLITMGLVSLRLYNRFKDKVNDDFSVISANKVLIEQRNAELSKSLIHQRSNSELLSAIMTVESVHNLAHIVLKEVGEVLGDAIGIFYKIKHQKLEVVAVHGADANFPKTIDVGVGVAGRSAIEKRFCRLEAHDARHNCLVMGESTKVKDVIAFPLIYGETCLGVIESASLSVFTEDQVELLETVAKSVSIQLLAVENRMRVSSLLEATKEQKTELEVQQVELQRANLDLEEKAQELYAQQAQLELLNTELETSKNELETKADELLKANNAKSMFLASVSHELRTPLNSILILSAILARSEGNTIGKQEVKNASVIHSAGEDLLNLIDDILDLAKIEAGHLHLVSEKIETRSIFEDMNDLFEQVAADKGLGWDVIVDDNIPDYIFADKSRVEQVIKNLLSNAMKFTKTGRVELLASRRDDNMIVVKVKDTGAGISEGNREKIFIAFEQESNAVEKEYGGTGLGLSISKSLALGMGGDLYLAESQLGVGSEFILTVPVNGKKNILCVGLEREILSEIKTKLDEPIFEIRVLDELPSSFDNYEIVITDYKNHTKLKNNLNEAIRIILISSEDLSLSATEMLEIKSKSENVIVWGSEACNRLRSEIIKPTQAIEIKRSLSDVVSNLSKEDQDFSGKDVLIVDDDLRNIFALRQVLEEVNLNVLTATNGKDALDILKDRAVDLVFMDIMMPVMNGLQAIKIIRNELDLSTLPVIALTAKAMSSDKLECLNAGASDYLSKPLDIEVVLNILTKWLRGV